MDENPYQPPEALRSKQTFRTIRSGLGWQIIGFLLYLFAMLPCCASMAPLFVAFHLAFDPVRDPRFVVWPTVVTGIVYGLVAAAMFWAGYRIRRVKTASDEEAPTHF